MEFMLTILLASVLGAAYYAAIAMLLALLLRIKTGGGHCTSYTRCLLFTLLLFVPLALFTKHLAATPYQVEVIAACLVFAVVSVIIYRRFAWLYVSGLAAGMFLLSLFLTTSALAGAMGMAVQGLMLTSLGNGIIKCFDDALKKIGL